MSDQARDELINLYESWFKSGQINRVDIIKGLAEFDATTAATRNAK